MRSILLSVIVVGCLAPAWAARPLITDDAGTLEKGRIETELSFDYCRYRTQGTCHSPGLAIKHGLTDRLDIGLTFSHSTDKDAEGNTVSWGMSPLEIGFKMAVLKEHRTLPDISLSVGYETGETEYGLNLIFSREYGHLGMHYNLGYNSPGEAMIRGSLATSLSAEYTFGGKYRVCGELNSEIIDDGSEVLGSSGLIGGSAFIGPINWDLGLRIHDQRGPKVTISTGITVGF